MAAGTRLLWGRFFTRAGDQAWDFALPLTLLALWPERLDLASFFYLCVKALGLLLTPRVAALIDTRPRRAVTRLGLGLQFIGVAASLAALIGLAGVWASGASAGLAEALPSAGAIPGSAGAWASPGPITVTPGFVLAFALLVAAGLTGTLGALLMDIAIAADLAPSLFRGAELARFNSRFRQVDLATEVGAPVAAGLVLAAAPTPLWGFAGIAAWNLVSFAPEWLILDRVFRLRPELSAAKIAATEAVAQGSLRERVRAGWRVFRAQPAAPVMIAYALLWFSVLSPHGVLLTGFLRDGWRLPEWQIGLFRGGGAVFGLAATWLYPWLHARRGLAHATGAFLGLQAGAVLAAGLAFAAVGVAGVAGLGGPADTNAGGTGVTAGEIAGLGVASGGAAAVLLFLGAVLVSRIGLYGFMLGETQIRQEHIAPHVRGRVNGFASVLNHGASLVVLALAALLPGTSAFGALVALSVLCVGAGFVVYLGAGVAARLQSS